MKNTNILIAAFGASLAIAQFPSGFPECGVVCINNMLGKAAEFNCQSSDAACLCNNQDFIYGVRDCADQACQNQGSASTVQDYGAKYCAEASVTVTFSPATAGSAAGTNAPGGSVSSFTTVITSGSQVITSTGATTFDVSTASSPQGTATNTDGLTTITTDGSTFTTSTLPASQAISNSLSSVLSSVSSASSSVASDASAASSSLAYAASSASSAASEASSSASSSSANFAPQVTAAPVGVMAVAGLAALLL